MAVLELTRSEYQMASFSTASRQLTTHSLQTAITDLLTRPFEVKSIAFRSQRRYNFPTQPTDTFQLIDESFKLPVSLNTALKTAAMYQGLNWELPSSRQYLAGEFFRRYMTLLLQDTIKLLATRQITLDLSLSNLVITVSGGMPTDIQIRRFAGVVGPAQILPETHAPFTSVSTVFELYFNFVTNLLAHNLRLLIATLVSSVEEKSEVFWDFAIEEMLRAVEALPLDSIATQQLRMALLVDELDPGDQLVQMANPTLTHSIGLVYMKRKCCKSYKKNDRCHNCPGNKKR